MFFLQNKILKKLFSFIQGKAVYSVLNIFASLCLVFILSEPSRAQSTLVNGTKFGDWTFECVAVTQSKTNCALSQIVLTKDGTQQAAKLNVLKLPGSKQWTMLVLVPLGIDLQFIITGWIDKSTTIKFQFDTCIPNGCIGSYSFDDKWSANLKNESTLSISFRAKDAKEATTLNVSLNGLLDAMKASNF
jgi:invasion protein IalB